jgi:hypothetical protein
MGCGQGGPEGLGYRVDLPIEAGQEQMILAREGRVIAAFHLLEEFGHSVTAILALEVRGQTHQSARVIAGL